MSIEARDVSKHFGSFTALNHVSLHVPNGELVALLGPSGSGKTTLLRIIAGLESPDPGSGPILFHDEDVADRRVGERRVGFVFQHYALFRHMTVGENIAFGLEVRGEPKTAIRERVTELLKLVSLDGLEGRFPHQLSGGQRQRVALARALAPRPQVLLLDEPFGALDAKVRDELREWIVRLHEETHMTTIFVTHDQHEAMEIATRVFVMDKGRIEQAGTPLEIFDRPRTEFVAQFVGESNFIESTVSAPELVTWGPFRFTVPGLPVGQKVRIYFRPHDVYVTSVPETLQVTARLKRSRFRGAQIELFLDVGENREVIAHIPKGVFLASGFKDGQDVFVGITAFQTFAV